LTKHRHGNQRVFSCKGIKLAIEHFARRGHTEIKALVPRFRRGSSHNDVPSTQPEILDELEKNNYLTYTPSRYVNNKLICPYDDRFILKAAIHHNAIIISNDNFRDLMQENNEWKLHIEKKFVHLFCLKH
jgi:ribonuclease ZC3H12